jgi:hypothetical protein
MSDRTTVYGECQYEGKQETMSEIFEEWNLSHLVIDDAEGTFTLHGEYQPLVQGPHGVVTEEYLIDCLNVIAEAVEVSEGEFRLYGPEWNQADDVVFFSGKFVRVPLELQPTLQSLDDPAVRDHYGLDYCIANP